MGHRLTFVGAAKALSACRTLCLWKPISDRTPSLCVSANPVIVNVRDYWWQSLSALGLGRFSPRGSGFPAPPRPPYPPFARISLPAWRSVVGDRIKTLVEKLMPVDPKNPEMLTSVPSDIEAAAIVAALAAHGVQASTTGSYTAGFRAEAPGSVNVIVRREDLDRARRVLAELNEGRTDVDWSQVDVGEPDEN